ncbi:MAG: DUF2388 domain-containing protein [Pseudomonas sp.]
MRHHRLAASIFLLVIATAAQATSFVVTTDTIGSALAGSSDTSTDISSSLNDDKLVLAARDDAASFIASQGAIRGVQLEAALRHIRQQAPQLQADDQQLAEAILAR